MRWTRRKVLCWIAAANAASFASIGALFAQSTGTDASTLEERLKGIKPEKTNDITLDVPVFAEAGDRVPVSLTTRLKDVDTISFLVEKSAQPWAATFRIEPPAVPMIRTQLRLEKSSEIIALVRTRNPTKYFYASIDVIVTNADGCL